MHAISKEANIMGNSSSPPRHGLPPTQAAATERLGNLSYANWDDFESDLLLAYGNTLLKFQIEVNFLIKYTDDETELIWHTLEFSNHVTYLNINKLHLQLRLFSRNPYYIVGDYLNYYPYVHTCTFIVIKKFVIVE